MVIILQLICIQLLGNSLKKVFEKNEKGPGKFLTQEFRKM
jgi:hypothetical protein